jgi:hypothetical protein
MAGVLRQLIRELKRVNPKKSVRDSLMYNYILEQYRIHQVRVFGTFVCSDACIKRFCCLTNQLEVFTNY